MTYQSSMTARSVAAVALLFALVPAVHASTLYVANNGVDGAGCGPTTSPCRSISYAIATAVAGDTIIVGPGRYGDLNDDGILGGTGEEIGVDDCAPGVFCTICCMVRVTKAVTIISSHGAASTMIDARKVNIAQNILLNGGEFGRPGKGFTVTNTKF